MSDLLHEFAGFPVVEDPTVPSGKFRIGPDWRDRIFGLPRRDVVAIAPGELADLREAIRLHNLQLPPRPAK